MRLITKFENGLQLMYDDKIDQYCLSDEYLTDWIIFYPIKCKQPFGLDGLFEYSYGISQEIRLYLNSIRMRMINNGSLT